jgi:hypothetical protein
MVEETGSLLQLMVDLPQLAVEKTISNGTK